MFASIQNISQLLFDDDVYADMLPMTSDKKPRQDLKDHDKDRPWRKLGGFGELNYQTSNPDATFNQRFVCLACVRKKASDGGDGDDEAEDEA